MSKGWIYIIESTIDHSFYLGSTNDLDRRIKQHNNGSVRSTKNKKPWKLHTSVAFDKASEARRIEQILKKQKRKINPEWIIDLISTLKV